MEVVLAIVTGTLYAGGIYLMMRRNPVQLIIGLCLLSHGSHLLIFAAAGLRQGGAPILSKGRQYFTALPADPLPQALILTAIVISFAVTAFVLALLLRAFERAQIDDIDGMKETDT